MKNIQHRHWNGSAINGDHYYSDWPNTFHDFMVFGTETQDTINMKTMDFKTQFSSQIQTLNTLSCNLEGLLPRAKSRCGYDDFKQINCSKYKRKY